MTVPFRTRSATPRTHAKAPVTPMLARKPTVRSRIIPRSNSIPWISPRPLCWNTRFSTRRVAAKSWEAKKNRIRVPISARHAARVDHRAEGRFHLGLVDGEQRPQPVDDLPEHHLV